MFAGLFELRTWNLELSGEILSTLENRAVVFVFLSISFLLKVLKLLYQIQLLNSFNLIYVPVFDVKYFNSKLRK